MRPQRPVHHIRILSSVSSPTWRRMWGAGSRSGVLGGRVRGVGAVGAVRGGGSWRPPWPFEGARGLGTVASRPVRRCGVVP